jgi:hypothetical protein
MERIPISTNEKTKRRETKKTLKSLYKSLLEIPFDATEEDEERYLQLQTDNIETLSGLIMDEEFSDEAIRLLAIIAMAHPGVGIPLKEAEYENGARAREILYRNKELLIERALDEKHHPQLNVVVQLESLPGYEEEIGSYLNSEVERIGLDLHELEEAWKQAGFERQQREFRMYNLSQLLRLEKKIPGAAVELFHRFGIADFARYPLEVLIEQYENRDNAESPYGIILYPRSDWNGAFYKEEDMLRELNSSLDGEYKLRIVECESKWDIGRQLLSLDAAYAQKENGNKISFAIICGHGNKEGIDFGQKDDHQNLVIDDLAGKGVRRSGSFFNEHPTLVLISCATGEAGGIGEALSKTFNATVVAPSGNTNADSITYDSSSKMFAVKYRRVETLIYKDGHLQE